MNIQHSTFNIQHPMKENRETAACRSTINNPTINNPSPPRCKHNVNYWRGGSFYGLGPARQLRTRRADEELVEYAALLRAVGKGKRAIESARNCAIETCGRNRRVRFADDAGWPFAEFRRATDFDLRDGWAAEMNQLVERGWGEILPDSFHLTRQGLRFADSAAELFLR